MTARVLTAATGATCPHGGLVVLDAGQRRVTSGGAPVLTAASTGFVVGCPNVVDGVPSPCVTVTWQTASRRVRVVGAPVLLESSPGTCVTATSVPQGTLMLTDVQDRVVAD